MLLPLGNHNSTFLFPSPLPKTLVSQSPNLFPKLLTLRPSAAPADTSTLPDSAIKRIADKLRSLGYVEDEEDSKQTLNQISAGEIFIPLPNRLAKHRVGHTIDPSWSSPENPVPEPGLGNAIQRFHQLRRTVIEEKYAEKEKEGKGRERAAAPTLAELQLPKEELRRLRAIGIGLKNKMKLGKAGITEGIVNGIHERWRRSELVKIVCDDICRLNMKRTHDLLERKTGGLVVWRSGGNIVLYRGVNYVYPYFSSNNCVTNDSSACILPSSRIESGVDDMKESGSSAFGHSPVTAVHRPLINGVGSPNRVRFQLPGEAQLAEEADRLLDGLGPRYSDWWGYEPLPVHADLLPATVPGYRRPFRLLPYGVKPTLTNDEMTILKRLGRPLPCHFVLGRNRRLQGLAASMVKLWERCEIAKIAVKRGAQNTNSELMAEELKRLTGGTLLSRDKEFIVFYRGKDFLPSAVSSSLEERRKAAAAAVEHRMGSRSPITMLGSGHGFGDELDVKDEGKDLVVLRRKPVTAVSAIEKTSNKLQMTLEKKAEVERRLAELEDDEIKQEYETDKEGITEEERYMLRKVGLRMKPFLLLGRRGVFDGTVENMHLHWKYRELVKVICGNRSIEEVRRSAQILEQESGGILVAVERDRKGYAIIIYRGKNYERPACLRPRTLLTKRQAMKRSIEAQRRESLKLHVLKLSKNVDDLKLQLVKDKENMEMLSANESNSHSAEGLLGLDEDQSLGLHEDKEGEFEIAESEQSLEGEPKQTNDLMGVNFKHEVAESVTCHNHESQDQTSSCPPYEDEQRGCDEDPEPASIESPNSGTELSSVPVSMGNTSVGDLSRATRLSNRQRLLLRKQALKMKKRPVLAVGRSNIVTGVAKAITAHFQRHPLAIVNVKGRAKGTSVQEVVFKLEQATGAVLVSQEPSKVILYRGWGGNVEAGQPSDKYKNGSETSSAGIISHELMSAIRLECGLQRVQDEEDEA